MPKRATSRYPFLCLNLKLSEFPAASNAETEICRVLKAELRCGGISEKMVILGSIRFSLPIQKMSESGQN